MVPLHNALLAVRLTPPALAIRAGRARGKVHYGALPVDRSFSMTALSPTRFAWLPLLFCVSLAAAEPPELTAIMADPDWIGPPVEAAWWALDGEAVYYRAKRPGEPARDTHKITLAGGGDEVLDPAALALIDGPRPVFNASRTAAVFVRDGDVLLRETASGRLRRLTGSADAESDAAFSTGDHAVHYFAGGQWWSYDLAAGFARQLTNLQFSKDPLAEPEDELAKDQLRLFSTLAKDAEEAKASRTEQAAAAAADHGRAAIPWHLGDEWVPAGDPGEDAAGLSRASKLSPDGRWLALVVQKAGADRGQGGKMPNYVTVSGYIEIEDVRTRVGRRPPVPQRLWLLDLEKRVKHELDVTALPGITDDPLAFLDQESKEVQDKQSRTAKKPEQHEPRGLIVMGLEWNRAGTSLAVQLQAIDNKDRWLAVATPGEAQLKPRHRLHDETWINWDFNDFGWLEDDRTLWLLSEESGYNHLYTVDAERGGARQRTKGKFEVMAPERAPGSDVFYLLSNRAHPTEYDLYRLDLADDALHRLTELRGVEDFTLGPAGERLLLRYSGSYLPAQLAVLNLASGEVAKLTDTRTERYRAIDWQAPDYVAVPSTHGAPGPIWSKFYPARAGAGPRPAVLFVHGAGYTQNTHHRFPYYFREQMFHNLLTARGYHVLDMDYRASKGYGRAWRGAIYRQMGHPELDDLLDGVKWLIEERGADAERIGLYGGSYGGFMTLMAMFRAPETFKAGAALRPVTDWAHYNHGYTSRILNTPERDPQAYLKSSPIEYAAGLEGHLLIAHGMLDDNVFYQDSVRLAQRLIELEKENWELASYPLEPHGFVHAASWLDEYRRLLKLFETTIGERR